MFNKFKLSWVIMLFVAMMMLTACGASEPTEAPAEEAPAEEAPAEEAPAEEAPAEEVPAEEADAASETLTLYSGRNEELVGPVIEMFEEKTGIKVEVRYGGTSEMAAAILEEGDNSPADVFFGQDAGALGALAKEGRFADLASDTLSRVETRFQDPNGQWVGISGRARVVAYNSDLLSEDDLPDSILDFTDPKWAGKIGWAPTNGSFQAFVTALRVSEGEDGAKAWLEGIQANNPHVYAKNTPTLEAVAAGEVEVGFINHYYLFRKLAEQGDFPAANYFFLNGDIGGLINVAGAGILKTSEKQENAKALLDFLLSVEGQEYFRNETKEYPLIQEVEADPLLPPLDQIQTPEIDLNDLDDLDGTLELLQDAGVL